RTFVSGREHRRWSSRRAAESERLRRRSTSRSCCPGTSSARSKERNPFRRDSTRYRVAGHAADVAANGREEDAMATLGRSGWVFATGLAMVLAAAPARAGQPTDQLRVEIDRLLAAPERQRAGRARA